MHWEQQTENKYPLSSKVSGLERLGLAVEEESLTLWKVAGDITSRTVSKLCELQLASCEGLYFMNAHRYSCTLSDVFPSG
jgi:hypothetical protein